MRVHTTKAFFIAFLAMLAFAHAGAQARALPENVVAGVVVGVAVGPWDTAGMAVPETGPDLQIARTTKRKCVLPCVKNKGKKKSKGKVKKKRAKKKAISKNKKRAKNRLKRKAKRKVAQKHKSRRAKKHKSKRGAKRKNNTRRIINSLQYFYYDYPNYQNYLSYSAPNYYYNQCPEIHAYCSDEWGYNYGGYNQCMRDYGCQ